MGRGGAYWRIDVAWIPERSRVGRPPDGGQLAILLFPAAPSVRLAMDNPPAALAHPLDDGTAVTLERDVHATAAQMGSDGPAYTKLFEPLVENWRALIAETLRPITIPQPSAAARKIRPSRGPACKSAAQNAVPRLRAKALIAGSCAHSCLKLTSLMSASFGMIIGGSGHAVGWPVPEGGSQQISNALAKYFLSLGGRIRTNSRIGRLENLARPT